MAVRFDTNFLCESMIESKDNAKFKLGSINGSKPCRTKSRAKISSFADL